MAMTAEQMLQKAHVTIMRDKNFCLLSSVVLCGKSTISETCPTAYTDSWNVIYGREFFSKLTDKERVGIVLHENLHKLLRQLTTWKKLWDEDAKCANFAADYVVNQMIVDLDPFKATAELPEGALLDPAYKGMNTKEVYDIIRKKRQSSGGGGGGGGSQSAEGDGSAMDEHDWQSASGVSEAEDKARGETLDQAVRQGQLLAGKMGSGGHRAITDLLEPKVNWREQLRDFMSSVAQGKDTTTWRKPNRRWLGQGMYMPSSQSEAMGQIVVAIDTSGSIGSDVINEFAAELGAICTAAAPEKVTLLWWDTSICGVQQFEPGDYESLNRLLLPKGGGGTQFECVLNYIAEHTKPECLITLTDGYFAYPAQPDYPVLFGITTRNTAPWGVTVRIGA